jgi:arginyl-tRNA synthetase
VKEYLSQVFQKAVDAFGYRNGMRVEFENPKVPEHGDLTTNIAMVLARNLKRNPRQVAADILNKINLDKELVQKVEVAGPGFINIWFTTRFYLRELALIIEKRESFGRSSSGGGKKTQVEFVSANPTGPLTVGHGRNGVFGDTVANLLEWTGHDVTREYYFNNAGRQMRILGDSVRLRYLELLGEQVVFPEDYYQGDYIREIAKGLQEEFGDKLRNQDAEGIFKQRAETEIFDDIKETCHRLGIHFDVFSNENSLYDAGDVKEVIEELRKKGYAYDQDGAVWFKATAFGGEKDKVVVKSTGEPTYRLPDIAYHREKFKRGFELIVDIFGADHLATYPDVLAGLKALGYEPDRIKVLIHQFVTLMRNGVVVKMSTRRATFVTLDELIDEVGSDAVRYFFLMRSIGSHLNFDLNLAKKQSDENPVYYVQYAHARIASIIRFAAESSKEFGYEIGDVSGIPPSPDILDLLSQQEELGLIKLLIQFPETVESCTITFEPHRLCDYLRDVATAFHGFYHNHRVVSQDQALTRARLLLCIATRTVLANGFSILGISAPERM